MHAGRFLLVALLLSLVTFLSPETAGQATSDIDIQVLKNASVPTDNDGLLEFFRLRTDKEGDKTLIETFIRKLDSGEYAEREKATRDLTIRGPRVAPILRQARATGTLETQRRIDKILVAIEAQGAEVHAAAARLLAARKPAAALSTLLAWLPNAGEPWAEEEALAAVGDLAIRDGKVDPLLLADLKEKLPARRANAVYVLGRRGDIDQRDTVRGFLADPDALVRQRALESLGGKRTVPHYQEMASHDAAILKGQQISTDETALLDFLRKRTLDDTDQVRLRKLIIELGDPSFSVRQKASKLLIKEGTPALAFLKPALASPDAEISRRALLCIDEIRRGPGPNLPIAALRLLARPTAPGQSPAAAIRVLLGYAPFADDESVEEELFTALTLLSLREAKIDPLLPAALGDPMPARRAAAGYVLGKVGLKEHNADLRKLLDDPVISVRMRAAQGLVAAKDKTAVPAFIALLKDSPPQYVWQVEETLHRLAGDKAPAQTVGEATPEKRQTAVKAWEKWWAAHASTVDLGRIAENEAYLGLLTVCEYDSAAGQPGGQVWEAARDGKPRWTIQGIQGAMDAHVLPNGRVLIAENSGNRVTERDFNGNIKWEYRTPGNPIAVQRLPNGNTFIATYNQVMEIKPDQTQLYLVQRDPQFYIFSARKMKNGNVVAMTAQGIIVEFDPMTKKDARPPINLGPNGGWCSVEPLPNGRYLVATMNNSQVREIDAAGKTYWSVTMGGAFRATRLPNGNTVVASMTTRLVAEYDRNGAKRWEKVCQGRPWAVRWR